MAVTLLPHDLIQPIGELDSAWFPGANLETLVTAALSDAVNIVESDANIAAAKHNRAAAAHVYARLYRRVASRLAATPQTLTVAGQITKVTDSSRVSYFAALAASKEDEYAGLAAPVDTGDTANQSYSIRARATW